MRLKLIESNDRPKLGDLVRGEDGILRIKENTPFWDTVVLPYGISDEEIQVGDWYINNGKTLMKCGQKQFNKWYEGQYQAIKPIKVHILPEQFNYEEIVELGLKDADEIEVQRFNVMNEDGSLSKDVPHLVEGKVSIIGNYKSSPKMYTEEEVLSLLCDANYDTSRGHIITEDDVIEWFNAKQVETKPSSKVYTEEEVVELLLQVLRECEHYDQMRQRLCGMIDDEEWFNNIIAWFNDNKK